MQWFKTSLAADPGNVESRYRLGQLYREQNQQREADGAFSLAMDGALAAEKANGTDWTKKNMPWITDLLYEAGEVFNRSAGTNCKAAKAFQAFVVHAQAEPLKWEVRLRTANRELATGLSTCRQ